MQCWKQQPQRQSQLADRRAQAAFPSLQGRSVTGLQQALHLFGDGGDAAARASHPSRRRRRLAPEPEPARSSAAALVVVRQPEAPAAAHPAKLQTGHNYTETTRLQERRQSTRAARSCKNAGKEFKVAR